MGRCMAGYTKNIAVIRGLKSGFSADGGELSGLVKAEKYGASLKVEVSLINFAPLTEGRYVVAVSDGKNTCILDGLSFDGASEVDTGAGFAALICFVNGTVSPVASAVCGNFHSAALGIREQIEKQEQTNLLNPPIINKEEPKTEEEPYEDEALAQENYYEYEQAYEGGWALREDPQKEKDGQSVLENEAASGAFKEIGLSGGNKDSGALGGLSRGKCFYELMKDEIEKVLSSFPKESALEETVENSRWVRINYGDNKYYVFGVIYSGGNPQYICYGVPSTDSRRPPESLAGLASFIPSSPHTTDAGYWIMYQDSTTGASVKISAE